MSPIQVILKQQLWILRLKQWNHLQALDLQFLAHVLVDHVQVIIRSVLRGQQRLAQVTIHFPQVSAVPVQAAQPDLVQVRQQVDQGPAVLVLVEPVVSQVRAQAVLVQIADRDQQAVAMVALDQVVVPVVAALVALELAPRQVALQLVALQQVQVVLVVVDPIQQVVAATLQVPLENLALVHQRAVSQNVLSVKSLTTCKPQPLVA